MLPPSRLRSGVVSVCVSNPAATRFPPFLLCFESELRDGSFYKKTDTYTTTTTRLGIRDSDQNILLTAKTDRHAFFGQFRNVMPRFALHSPPWSSRRRMVSLGPAGQGWCTEMQLTVFFYRGGCTRSRSQPASQPACQRASQPVGRQFLIRRSCKFGAEMGDAASAKGGGEWAGLAIL